jgi:hypothetical protein
MDDFRDRVTEKLKKDIGEMLPDEVLQQLTQRAVDEQFFKERRIPRQYAPDEVKPSWFVEEVAKIAEPIIKDAIQKFVDAHTGDIEAAIEQYISKQNLTLTASAMIGSQMSSHMSYQIDQIIQTILNHPGRI